VRSVLELAVPLASACVWRSRVLRMNAARRPPTIAPAEQRAGVWHLNGLFRHGYLCALVTNLTTLVGQLTMISLNIS
jgi:glycine oxidase